MLRFFVISAAVSSLALAKAPPDILPVVPAVRDWVPTTGTLSILNNAVSAPPDLAAMGAEIGKELTEVGIKGNGPANVALAVAPDEKLGDEGYRIVIGESGATITAPTPDGVFHGSRTLLQLVKGGKPLPYGTITDYPTTKRRIFMLDVGRKPFPVPVLKDFIRILAWYKMNEFHIHFSDEAFGGTYSAFRIQSDTFPGLAAKDFSYSKKDIREIQDFAKARGITITPEIDMPGHARCFTQYWPAIALKGNPSYMDVTNPETIKLMKQLLDEMIPLFDAPDFHIGTDEYRVGDRPDLHEAFRKFINTMNAHIRSKGKNTRIWSGFEHMKGETEIDPTVIIDMWETDDAKGQIDKGHSIINSNHGRTYIVPGCHYYGISCPDIYENWQPHMVSGNPAKNPTADDPKLLGGKLHVWNDHGPTGYTIDETATLALPGIQAFSEKLWGVKGSPDYKTFIKRCESTLPIPGVTIFDRIPAKGPGGVILDVPKEMTLANKDSFIPLPYADAERADLEYPWTLTFEAKSAGPSDNRAVILSSDLAEICAGSRKGSPGETVAQFANGTNRPGKINICGLGTVRLAGDTRGKDPFEGFFAHDVSKFSGVCLEPGKWTTICVVGTAGTNTIYVNGERVMESNNQMLCPLRWLGSRTGNSFVGSVRKLRVINRALNAKEVARAAGITIPENVAENAATTATRHYPSFPAANATDGNASTRWSSGDGQEGILTVDFGAQKTVSTVKINWETAYAKKYEIAVSNDNKSWRTVFKGEGKEGPTLAGFPPAKARYLRVTGTEPGTGWGYSIWELEAYGPRL